jgi:hypothetical protein
MQMNLLNVQHFLEYEFFFTTAELHMLFFLINPDGSRQFTGQVNSSHNQKNYEMCNLFFNSKLKLKI